MITQKTEIDNDYPMSAQLDQLYQFSSNTILPLNLSTTSQLLCAQNIKLHYFHTLN